MENKLEELIQEAAEFLEGKPEKARAAAKFWYFHIQHDLLKQGLPATESRRIEQNLENILQLFVSKGYNV